MEEIKLVKDRKDTVKNTFYTIMEYVRSDMEEDGLLAEKTINEYIGSIKKSLEYCAKNKIIPQNYKKKDPGKLVFYLSNMQESPQFREYSRQKEGIPEPAINWYLKSMEKLFPDYVQERDQELIYIY